MLNEVLDLITELGAEYDSDGFKTGEERQILRVFGAIKSTTYGEYYESVRAGQKATEIFVINEIDYNMAIANKDGKKIKPSMVEYDGTMYRIIRKFKKATNNDKFVELTCEEVE